MRSDVIRNKEIRALILWLDRFDFYKTEVAQNYLDRNGGWITRGHLIDLIQYIAKGEHYESEFTKLEKSVMAHPDAAQIFRDANLVGWKPFDLKGNRWTKK